MNSETVFRTAPRNMAVELSKHLAPINGGQVHIAFGGLFGLMVSMLSVSNIGRRMRHTCRLGSLSVPVQETRQP
jgi:hypothetical protein